jgi:hypothetical protein
MSTAKVKIDDNWVTIPETSYHADYYGWYSGAEFARGDLFDVEKIKSMQQWCLETFGDSPGYIIFYNSVWFYREQDAFLCRLKWS